MKRKALLIGNSNGLSGIQIDLERFESFLHSNEGGAWNLDEIIVLPNASKKELFSSIDDIIRLKVDYCIVYFSGHGAFERQTFLELADGSVINENELFNLSDRQLTIFDCCRSVIKREIFESVNASFESLEVIDSDREYYRKKYNERILKATKQQAILYSCEIGEVSYDTGNGSVYTNALLETLETMNVTLTVGQAHYEAVKLVNSSWNIHKRNKEDRQNPNAILPKCFTSQQLIFSQEIS